MNETFNGAEFFRRSPERLSDKDKTSLAAYNNAFTAFYPLWKEGKINDVTYDQKRNKLLTVARFFLKEETGLNKEITDYIKTTIQEMFLDDEIAE